MQISVIYTSDIARCARSKISVKFVIQNRITNSRLVHSILEVANELFWKYNPVFNSLLHLLFYQNEFTSFMLVLNQLN